MHPLPHHYEVTAAVDAAATITPIETSGVGRLDTAAPLEFDGPGDQWSPETLLVGAIASCYVLSFRAIASASKLDWRTLTCRVTGTLDRADKGMRFVSVVLAVELTLADAGASRAAERIVHKAEENCLVTNSLSCEVELTATIAAAG